MGDTSGVQPLRQPRLMKRGDATLRARKFASVRGCSFCQFSGTKNFSGIPGEIFRVARAMTLTTPAIRRELPQNVSKGANLCLKTHQIPTGRRFQFPALLPWIPLTRADQVVLSPADQPHLWYQMTVDRPPLLPAARPDPPPDPARSRSSCYCCAACKSIDPAL